MSSASARIRSRSSASMTAAIRRPRRVRYTGSCCARAWSTIVASSLRAWEMLRGPANDTYKLYVQATDCTSCTRTGSASAPLR
jgi:hypothetical protein